MSLHPSPVRIRIRSLSGDFYAMGPGKAELLVAIQETGAISAAGRKLGMSYQKTRLLVDEMNLSFQGPLIEGFKGGSHGGGAKLTPLGHEILERFHRLQSLAESAISPELEAFKQLLAP
jgi:molybdate transport system regulatory protein